MPPAPQIADWGEWGRHVLLALEKNEDDHTKLSETLSTIQLDIAKLQMKAGLWGALAGAVPGIAAAVIMLVVFVAKG